VHARARIGHVLYIVVEARQCLAHFRRRVPRRPGFHVPVWVRHAHDEVDFVAAGVDRIDLDVSIGPPPLRAAVDHEVPQQLRGTTVRCATRPVKTGFSGPSSVSQQGVRTIDPGHRVGPDAAAVGKAQIDAGALAIETHEFFC